MNIQEITEVFGIPMVQKRNYWFIRTQGGDFFPDFTINTYIAIGWDYVSISDMKQDKNPEIVRKKIEINELPFVFDFTEEKNEDIRKGEEENSSERKRKISSIYNKINSFVNEMAIGDVVLIPSYNSDKLVIGIVDSEAYEDKEYIEKFLEYNPDSMTVPCPYYKRRQVNWIKTHFKDELDIYLQNAIRSQQALSSLNDYADIINRNIYEIYISDNELHSIVRSELNTDFSFADLKLLTDLIYDSYTASGLYDAETFKNMKIKLNINSPLYMEIILGTAAGITIITPLLAIFAAYKQSKIGGTMKFGKFMWQTDGENKSKIEEERLKLQKEQIELTKKILESQQLKNKLVDVSNLGILMPEIDKSNND